MLWFRILSFIDCNNICRCYHLLCGYALLLRLIWKILVRDESSPNIQSTRSPTIYTEATVHHTNTWTSLIRNLNTLFFLFIYECETIYTIMVIKRSDLIYRSKRLYLNYSCCFCCSCYKCIYSIILILCSMFSILLFL